MYVYSAEAKLGLDKKFIRFQKFQNQKVFQDIQNYFDFFTTPPPSPPPPPNDLFPKKLTKMARVWSHSLQIYNHRITRIVNILVRSSDREIM